MALHACGGLVREARTRLGMCVSGTESFPEGHRGATSVVRPEGWVQGEAGFLGRDRGPGGAEGTVTGAGTRMGSRV